jgi:solute carrier family 25, member 42
MGEKRAEERENQSRTSLLSFLAGGLAGSVAKSTIAPLDRVKIIFMTSDRTQFSFRAVAQELRRIGASEGARGLWRGNGATVARVYPYAGIQYLTFGRVTARLKERRPDGRLQALDRLAAGALAGALSSIATLPLDTARARLAVYRYEAPSGASASASPSHDSRLTGVLLSMWREGGVRRLYRGLGATLLGIVPYSALSFTTFETLKQMSRDRKGRRDGAAGEGRVGTWERLMYGAIAGLVGQTASFPVDVCRRRIQTGHFPDPADASTLRVMQHVLRTNGIGGLFRGLPLNWVKGPVSVAISFTIYDTLARRFHFASHPDRS